MRPEHCVDDRSQARLVHDMLCPRCGHPRLVPILYGYPLPVLLVALRWGDGLGPSGGVG